MSKLKSTLGIVVIAFMTLTTVSCKDAKKEHNNEKGHHSETSHDMTAKVYGCPMKCEGDKTYDKEGKCPKCGMDLNAVENHGNYENGDGHHNDTPEKGNRAIKASAQKNTATSPIIDAYIQIKNGLVADSKENAAKGGTALLAAFSKFDMSKLTGDTHKEYMEIFESAKEHAEHIVKSPIDHQREHFEVLSTDVSDLITLLGTEKTLYKDFCPMANNNKGAYWLSEIKDIKNPFFGAKMMKCGSIKEQIN